MDNKKNDAVNLHIQMPKLLLKRFYNEYGKCNLFSKIFNSTNWKLYKSSLYCFFNQLRLN